MFRHLEVHRQWFSVSENLQMNSVSYHVLVKFQRQIAHTANGPAAEAHNDIADLDSDFVSRLIGYDVFDEHTIFRLEVECSGQSRCDGPNKNADLSPMHVPVLLQGRVCIPNDVARYCETDPFAATGLRENKRVHSDNTSRSID